MEEPTQICYFDTSFPLLVRAIDNAYFSLYFKGAFTPGIKRPERETDHSFPSSAEVKNAWNYTSTPQIRLHGAVSSGRCSCIEYEKPMSHSY
jgi:hypothetical protein